MATRDRPDVSDLDPSPYLTAARLRVAELGRCEPGSGAWDEALKGIGQAAEGLMAVGILARRQREERLSLVGLPDPFRPDGVGIEPPVPRGLGRRIAPEVMR